jgi:RNA polymerase sigma factor (sigma-70 family)
MELTQKAPLLSPVRSEAALVDAARRGDDRAFERLYADYRDRIYAFIHSKVRDHGRAEDLCQEVFMSALRQLRACDQKVHFKPWLYTIAKNACIDEYRRGSRVREVGIESGEDLTPGTVSSDRLLSALPTPAAAIESKQNLDDLRGAFGGLSESQHRLLVLREFEGLSYDEIGAQLGMTKQTVESGLFRARRKLSEEYDELASGRRCQQIQSAIDGGLLQSARRLGIKERRRYSRHLSHCQACRHVAMMTGVDAALLKPRSIVDKVAALLPFGLLRRLWPFGGRGGGGGAAGGAGHAAAGGTAAGVAGTSAGAGIGGGQAAAVAVLALAGAGGGFALATHSGAHPTPLSRAGHHATAGHGASGVAPRFSLAVTGSSAVRSSHGVSLRGSSHARAGGAFSNGRGGLGAGAIGRGATAAASGTSGHAPTSSSHPGSTSTTSGGAPSGGSGSGASTGVHATAKNGASGAASTVDKTTNGVKTTVSKTTSTVKSTVNSVATGAGKTVTSVTSGVGGTVSTTASGVGTTVSTTASGVGTTATKAASGVGTTVTKTASGLGSTLNTIVPGAGTTVTNTGATAGATINAVGSTVGSTVTNTGTAASTTVTATGTTVGSILSGLG